MNVTQTDRNDVEIWFTECGPTTFATANAIAKQLQDDYGYPQIRISPTNAIRSGWRVETRHGDARWFLQDGNPR